MSDDGKAVKYKRWLTVAGFALTFVVGVQGGWYAFWWTMSAGPDVGDAEIQRWSSDVRLLLDENGGLRESDEIRERLIQRVTMQTVNIGHLHRLVRTEDALTRAFETASAIERSEDLRAVEYPGAAGYSGAVRDCILAGEGKSAERVVECSARVVSGG